MIVDKLFEHVKERGHVCIGLDTDYSYLPEAYAKQFKSKAEAIYNFNKDIIDATYDLAACYKVQIAYYEAMGIDGLRAYSDTLKYIKEKGQISIADIKRGDISKTAEMYAAGHFSGDFEADFVTLSPYMGINDSIEPFLKYIKENEKGIFVLVRTSNQGAKDFQYIKDENGLNLYENVADMVEKLAEENLGSCGFSSIGSVVGATNNEESGSLRKRLKTSFLLIPGYGAQGGKAEDIKAYLINGNGAVVNSSRGILLAYKKENNGEDNFAMYARNEVIRMRDDIRANI
ncbi:orotidine-5'-phosphate decarboxylase [Sedimentibacter hydroxybenzoicus DSM 7310]|uniref:Orotidine 5'-phosphate decarboxylase n=1 Tax=Sedimentibacter hydroxybenzoicus DSM 7310 TaxID=1123245 RepID=A0A974BHZ1_SEDHY|nr:orotidine-5'-phosphate decarboxylase [Sedimentibacter hydroxybenzoicus]NYB73025.1 orotidine-5'-phosphate decarboxylase [Sedimentibacter hydroxybenzoicus DSM 7310]